jgi:vancomycin permeability regulator SanA
MNVSGEKMHKKRFLTVSFAVAAALIIFSALTIFALNTYVMTSGGQYIITPEAAEKLEDIDCIIVLGCLVYDDGTPSDRLADRIQGGIDLYCRGVAPKIIMSGDHGREDYDEVGAMKRTAIVAGVPSSDIFMDHAGFSTYESIYRAKEIFGADLTLLAIIKEEQSKSDEMIPHHGIKDVALLGKDHQ